MRQPNPAPPKRSTFLLLVLFLLVTALFAWAPWITPSFAAQRAEDHFTSSWQGVADGCGLHCTGCGAIGTQKVLFGALVELEYACGMLPSDSSEFHQRGIGFVSFLGTVHGFGGP